MSRSNTSEENKLIVKEKLPATSNHLDNMFETSGDLQIGLSNAFIDEAKDWIYHNSRVSGNDQAFDEMNVYVRSLISCANEKIPGTETKVSDLEGWKQSMTLVQKEISYIEDQHEIIVAIAKVALELLKDKRNKDGLSPEEERVGEVILNYNIHLH